MTANPEPTAWTTLNAAFAVVLSAYLGGEIRVESVNVYNLNARGEAMNVRIVCKSPAARNGVRNIMREFPTIAYVCDDGPRSIVYRVGPPDMTPGPDAAPASRRSRPAPQRRRAAR